MNDETERPEDEKYDMPEFNTGANYTPPEENEPNVPAAPDGSLLPVPVGALPVPALPPVEPPPLSRDQIKRRCQARFGIEPDELDTLYPNDDDLRAFYSETALKLSEIEGEPEDGKKDLYKLSKKEKVALSDVVLNRKREAAVKSAAKKAHDKEVFEKHGEHLSSEEKVSWEDAQKALKAALSPNKPVKVKKNKKHSKK